MVGVDRPEHGRSERSPQRSEERDPRRGHAEVAVLRGALHDDREDLHAQAEAHPEDHEVRERTQNDVVGFSRDSSRRPTAIRAEPETGKILYLPVLPTIVPAAVEATNRPTTIGSVRRPDEVALTPRTYCR